MSCDCCSPLDIGLVVEVEFKTISTPRYHIETPPEGFPPEMDIPPGENYPAFQECEFTEEASGNGSSVVVDGDPGCERTREWSGVAAGLLSKKLTIDDQFAVPNPELQTEGPEGQHDYNLAWDESYTGEECVPGGNCSDTWEVEHTPNTTTAPTLNTIRQPIAKTAQVNGKAGCNDGPNPPVGSAGFDSQFGVDYDEETGEATYTQTLTLDPWVSGGAGALTWTRTWKYRETLKEERFLEILEEELDGRDWIADTPMTGEGSERQLSAFSKTYGTLNPKLLTVTMTKARYRLRMQTPTCRLRVVLTMIFTPDDGEPEESDDTLDLISSLGSPCLPEGHATGDWTHWEEVSAWIEAPLDMERNGTWSLRIKSIQPL